jgi:hypothetical protein
MDATQRFGIIWCLLITIVIGYFNVDYMAGWGAGNSIEVGSFVLPYSWVLGTIAIIIDVGMVLSLGAMARWNHEQRHMEWFMACGLFLMFTAFSGHSLWRDLQTNIGSKQETAERSESAYKSAERERDSTQSLLVTLRAELAAKPSIDVADMRRQLAAIPANEKTNIAKLERQISGIETEQKVRSARLERDITSAETRLAKSKEVLGWSPIQKKAAPISGFEGLIAGGLMITDIVGWVAIVGVGVRSRQPDRNRSTPPENPKPGKRLTEIEQSISDPQPPYSGPPKLVVDNVRKKRKTVTDEIISQVLEMKGRKLRDEDIAKSLDVAVVTVRRVMKRYGGKPVLGRMARLSAS